MPAIFALCCFFPNSRPYASFAGSLFLTFLACHSYSACRAGFRDEETCMYLVRLEYFGSFIPLRIFYLAAGIVKGLKEKSHSGKFAERAKQIRRFFARLVLVLFW